MHALEAASIVLHCIVNSTTQALLIDLLNTDNFSKIRIPWFILGLPKYVALADQNQNT